MNEGAGVAAGVAEDIIAVEERSRQVRENSSKLNNNAMDLSKIDEAV